MTSDILQQLDTTIKSRREVGAITDPLQPSYVAELFAKGRQHIAQKVGEEAIETIIAAMAQNNSEHSPQPIVAEMADLWFHCLVLLAEQGLDSSDVLRELERRSGRSGIAEKAGR